MSETPNHGALIEELRHSKDEWQWSVYRMMNNYKIPAGTLINYGRLAQLTNQEYGTNINARNVAALRRKLYEYRRSGTYEVPTDVPLHRIAKKGDVESRHDSERTRQENNRLRSEEGSLQNPIWI